MPMRTYVFRIYPSRAQHTKLSDILENQRQLYNAALEERISAWQKAETSIYFNDQTKSLTQIRGFDEKYGSVAYNVSKWTLKRLDGAFKNFFARAKSGKVGFPRFRSKGRWRSFGYHQKAGLRMEGEKLLLVGVHGGLRFKIHRGIPSDAKLKSAIFTIENGIWRVALTMAIAATEAVSAHPIGIDVGVNYLATDSAGNQFENVKALSAHTSVLRISQRKLSRAKRGSKRRRKAIASVRKVHAKIKNHRRTHLHEVANAIVRRSPVIIVEKLKLKNMTRSAKRTLAEPGVNVRQKAGLNRVLQDAAPVRLISMLSYKAESAGGKVIKVNPKNTSITCSCCGRIDAKQAGRTRYICVCGLNLHRDHNAAINILKRGQIFLAEAARGLEDVNVADNRKRRPVNVDPLAA